MTPSKANYISKFQLDYSKAFYQLDHGVLINKVTVSVLLLPVVRWIAKCAHMMSPQNCMNTGNRCLVQWSVANDMKLTVNKTIEIKINFNEHGIDAVYNLPSCGSAIGRVYRLTI